MTRPTALHVTMPDGSVWSVPVEIIAKNRAEVYKGEFEGSHRRSLDEDTWPLFEDDPFEITDWAANNMNWEDVAEHATKVEQPDAAVDYQEGWVNGDKDIVTE